MFLRFFALNRLLYGPPATTTFEYEDDNQCIPPPDDDEDEHLTLVDEAIRGNCDCVRSWMRGGVYFDPVATSYAAILVAIAFMLRRLFSPLSSMCSSIIKTMFRISSSPTGRLLNMFHMLPQSSRSLVHSALQMRFPDMPDIGPRPKGGDGGGGGGGDIEAGGDIETREKWVSEFSAASKTCMELLEDSRRDPGMGDMWTTWKAEWNKASARHRDLMAKEPKVPRAVVLRFYFCTKQGYLSVFTLPRIVICALTGIFARLSFSLRMFSLNLVLVTTLMCSGFVGDQWWFSKGRGEHKRLFKWNGCRGGGKKEDPKHECPKKNCNGHGNQGMCVVLLYLPTELLISQETLIVVWERFTSPIHCILGPRDHH